MMSRKGYEVLVTLIPPEPRETLCGTLKTLWFPKGNFGALVEKLMYTPARVEVATLTRTIR